MFILSFVLIGMHSIYIWQLVRPVATPLIMHMCGYIRGVATVWIYPYPAVIFSQVSFCPWGGVWYLCLHIPSKGE